MIKHYAIIKKQGGQPVIQTTLRGKPLLTVPQLNKGTAFNEQERRDLRLSGKLPMRVETLDEQVRRAYGQCMDYHLPIHQNIFLSVLHNTNEVLFHALMRRYFNELMPIAYTPVIGDSVMDFNQAFRQARGLYIAYPDRDNIDEILANRTNSEIDLIVITDGSGILGLGDQGVGGIHIPVAKLVLYSAIGGISPYRTLPIVLDVGTDNQKLLQDPMYLGWRHPRIAQDEFEGFVERVIQAIKRFDRQIFVHWEDFSARYAMALLARYKKQVCSFNDDIQGTGVVALSALLTALKKKGSSLAEQRIVIFGAGSAGCGIADHLYKALLFQGIDEQVARAQFWLVDRDGVIFTDTPGMRQAQQRYARPAAERMFFTDSQDFASSLTHIRASVLIGCSAVHGAFDAAVMQALLQFEERPVVLPLSNPNTRAEATPSFITEASGGRALIATGSPFSPFEYQGQTLVVGQCNNAYAFPGIGLAVVAVKAERITRRMLMQASWAISEVVMQSDNADTLITPTPDMAVEVAKQVAIAVARAAIEEGVAGQSGDPEQLVTEVYWEPQYYPIEKA